MWRTKVSPKVYHAFLARPGALGNSAIKIAKAAISFNAPSHSANERCAPSMERRFEAAVYAQITARRLAWGTADVEAAMSEAILAGRTILVVEDESLIAREVAQALESAGANAITARGVADAERIIAGQELSAAVLDFWLGVGVDCLPMSEMGH